MPAVIESEVVILFAAGEDLSTAGMEFSMPVKQEGCIV